MAGLSLAARSARGGRDARVAGVCVLPRSQLCGGKGDELARWIRNVGYRVTLVAVSARAEGNEALVAAGVDAVCAKLEFSRIISVLGGLGRET